MAPLASILRLDRLPLVIGGMVLIFAPLLAQPPFPSVKKSPASGQSDSLPPMPKMAVEHFRELLNLTAAEREEALAEKSPEQKRLLLAKLREYESLKPEERDLRLRLIQLRLYLVPLMKLPPSERRDKI